MARYLACYATACMTRQHLERLVRTAHDLGGRTRSLRVAASFTGGRMVWEFESADREELDRWLALLQAKNYEWLVKLDYAGEGGEIAEL